MEKITQRDFINKALEIMAKMEDMDDFNQKGKEMLVALDKKKSSSKANKKKLEEQKALENAILDILTNNGGVMTCSQIANELTLMAEDGTQYSTQKVSPRLGTMVVNGTIVSKLEKRVKYYSIA